MKKKKYYIVLVHTYVPSKTNPGKHEAMEKCEFVNRVSNKHLSNATVILDVVNKKFTKNRIEGATYEQFIGHVKKQHPQEWSKFNELMTALGVFDKPIEEKSVNVDTSGNIKVV